MENDKNNEGCEISCKQKRSSLNQVLKLALISCSFFLLTFSYYMVGIPFLQVFDPDSEYAHLEHLQCISHLISQSHFMAEKLNNHAPMHQPFAQPNFG